MYRALYRKWRPKTFSDVVGQAGITAALQNQITHDKVGHAYLFTGTRGTGKTSCAKIFAKAVNCPHRTGADPCCECEICKGIDNGSVMDVVEIDAASNNGVDNIRDLRDETAYTPSQCTYKVYIIDEVHMLSTAAFNALLKIMEEPPAHVIFILATTEIHKVPATILSRCQRYDFMRIKPQDIEARLLYVAGQEGIQLAQDAAELISRLADGAMRDALSILDTCAGVGGEVTQQLVRRMAGVTDKSYLFDISDAVLRADAAGVLALVAQLREKSVDVKRLCDELILHYRNLLLAGVPGGQEFLMGTSAEEQARYEQAAKNVPPLVAVRAVKVLSMEKEEALRFAHAIEEAHTKIHRCKICQNFTEDEVCPICQDERRDRSTICVVETPRDVTAFERTREYKGLYHVLHGLISPMDGIGAEQLCIKELLARLQGGDVKEIIMATNPTVEGEATAMYVARLVKPLGVKATRLAYGLPVGSNLEYADEVTLGRSLANRGEL